MQSKRIRSRHGYSKKQCSPAASIIQIRFWKYIMTITMTRFVQRKATQLAAYGLQLSLLCALYMKLRRQVGDGGWRRGDGFVK
jgi:hypothetical protein